MPDYMQQNSTLTLQQGLEEYTKAFADVLTTRVMSAEGEAFFRSHDVVHVVFGCGLELKDEAVVKISSFMGTTGGMDVLRGYRLPESKEIYEELTWTDIVSTTLQSLVIVPRTIVRCVQMSQRWPWSNYQPFLGVPLNDLRHQFGIRVPH